jgi:hypothetical protein
MAEQIAELQQELKEAEEDLRESLHAVNQKVEAIGARLPAEVVQERVQAPINDARVASLPSANPARRRMFDDQRNVNSGSPPCNPYRVLPSSVAC